MTKELFRRLWVELKPIYLEFKPTADSDPVSAIKQFYAQRNAVLQKHNVTFDEFDDACYAFHDLDLEI